MIDWDLHCRRIIAVLEQGDMTWPCELERLRHGVVAWYVPVLARLLGSRHIPDSVRSQHPGIPWRGIQRLAAHIERVNRGIWPNDLDPAVIHSFHNDKRPALIEETRRMREFLVGTDVDGNMRDGVLAVQERGRFVHITLRLPDSASRKLSEFIRKAYAGEPVLTVEAARQRLASAAAELRARGVSWIGVYGSVARGTATASSDVDLAYRLTHEPTFDDWVALSETFERILGKIVDAHRVKDEECPDECVIIWEAE
jgi:predicted nucleotidyltransferase